MKKNITIVLCLFCINLITGYSQENRAYSVYGRCQSIYNCFQIVLFENGNFRYYINEYVPGKAVVNGSWNINKDTLLLSINVPLPEESVIVTNEGETDSICRLRFYLVSRDTMPISNAKVEINNDSKILSDANGIVLYKNPITNVSISYHGMLQDSTFVLKEKAYKKIDFYIPLCVYAPITHQQPTKWLIEGNYLMPFLLTDGKYELRRDRAIKKVPKRKTLPELR